MHQVYNSIFFEKKNNFILSINEFDYVSIDEAFLSPNELANYHLLSHQKRKNEFLGLRKTLHELGFKTDISYQESGKPYFKNSDQFISLSHCGKFCGAIVANFPVGLDIESISSKIEKVAHKFIHDSEKELFKTIEGQTMAWSIKEALFKLCNKSGLDFKKDLQILCRNEDVYHCEFEDLEGRKQVRVISWKIDDLIISYNFEPPSLL